MKQADIELYGEEECDKLEAFLIERIYEFNSHATGFFDGRLIGGGLRTETGEIIAAFNGHTWGGCCVVAHLWVHRSHRGQGIGAALLHAAEAEALRRDCQQLVVSTHSFQAPAFYERFGYRRKAFIREQPRGHATVIYLKQLKGTE